MVVVSNDYLSLPEMTENAEYILTYLTPKGWTKNAICGMLGNMQTESTVNPGLWQNRDEGNTRLGFGLVQWTPATKYITWANQNGFQITDIDGQLDRLDYEVTNKLQWIKTAAYPLSFEEFKVSNLSPEYLAQAFLRNYERPKNQNQPLRSTQARYWFDNLTGGACITAALPVPDGTPISSPYGWRKDPFTGVETFHAGTDYASGLNTPIYATQTGIVMENGFNSISGWYVNIQHTKDKYYSRYQHLSVRSPLQENMPVLKGDRVGGMGETGSATGIHLHFVISTNGTSWFTEEGTMNPEVYLTLCEGGDTPNPPKPSTGNEIIKLLLADTLNGWKY